MKIVRLIVAAAALALVFACSSPERDWQKAQKENTEAAFQAFLEKHPEGEWAQKAQAQLDAIKDTRDWENAQTSDAVAAYNNYLLAHPTGAHMGEARQRVTDLQTAAAWSAAQAAGTREALEQFLMQHADAPQAEQARSQLAALAPPPPPETKTKTKSPGKTAAKAPTGDYHVQLGAFSSQDKAKTEQASLEKRFHNLVGSLVVQKPSGSDHLYRVKTAGMTEAAARSACQKLKDAGQECVVARR